MAENVTAHPEAFFSHQAAAEALLDHLSAQSAKMIEQTEIRPKENIDTAQVGGSVPALATLNLQTRIATGGTLNLPDKVLPVTEPQPETVLRPQPQQFLLIKGGVIPEAAWSDWEHTLQSRTIPYRTISVATRANMSGGHLEYVVTLDGKEIKTFMLTDPRIQKHHDDPQDTIEPFSPSELAYIITSFPDIQATLENQPNMQVVLSSSRGVAFPQAQIVSGLSRAFLPEPSLDTPSRVIGYNPNTRTFFQVQPLSQPES